MSTDFEIEEEVKVGDGTNHEGTRDLMVYNDDFNTFDHVIETLVKVCKHDARQAEQCTYLIHYKGKCLVKKGGLRRAEAYARRDNLCRDQSIHCLMEYPSKLIEKAVEEIAKLPSIGKKTALRLALHLLKQPEELTSGLSSALQKLRQNIKYCKTCHIIADTEECTCQNAYRDTSVICVVEDTPDVLAIRNTGQYSGLFHVLGGRISPMDGIGPESVNIVSLIHRVKNDHQVQEIILALSATLEGDTTSFYITKLLKDHPVKMTTIARGIPVGSELEFADDITLGRSIATRTLFDHS